MRYTLETHDGAPDGSFRNVWANASWTYANGDWTGTCEGKRVARDGGGTWDNATLFRTFTAADPPHWPLFDTLALPDVGENVTVWNLYECGIGSMPLPYRGPATETWNGRTIPSYAAGFNDGYARRVETEWSQTSGLVLWWDQATRFTSADLRLTATDAPMG